MLILLNRRDLRKFYLFLFFSLQFILPIVKKQQKKYVVFYYFIAY